MGKQLFLKGWEICLINVKLAGSILNLFRLDIVVYSPIIYIREAGHGSRGGGAVVCV